MSYVILDRDTLPEYISKLVRPMEVLGTGDELDITEIGDGNLNFVFRVSRPGQPGRSIIVKQAVPYLRMAGESWPLNKNRMITEIRALQTYNEIVPDFVPDIYHVDENMCVIMMEDLGAAKVLRYSMMEGEVFPGVGEEIGKFLAESLFRTSYVGMQSVERRELMQKFVLNDDLCKLTEEFIFTFPFVNHESNYQNSPVNKYALEVLSGDSEYLRRVLRFKELFLSKSDALIHGDLHTGSLMAGLDGTYVIDSEFAFFGPFGFDVGKIIGNFLMSYTSHFHRNGGEEYQNWLLGECAAIWNTFERDFLRLWESAPNSALIFDGMLRPEDLAKYKQNFMTHIFQDAVGFCACSLARRTVGIAGVADIRDIEDIDVRTRLEKTNIDLSHFLMMNYENIPDIASFIAEVKSFYAQLTIRS